MNVLDTLHCWELYMVGDDMIIRWLEYFGGGHKNEKVLRIDFENKLVETEVGYYKLGEHK